MKIQPKENYRLAGCDYRLQLDKTKTYTAAHATNQPDWRARGKVFVSFNNDGEEPTIMLEADDYTVIMRSPREIACEISRTWENINYAAKPYLVAMYQLHSVHDQYMYDSGASIIRYFLSNAGGWRGEDAKRIKSELRDLLK